jgi:hypothetical protein
MTTDTQPQLMAFDPATGEPRPYPSHAGQWREYHGTVAWLFNPWTGARRLADDVGVDPLGRLVQAIGLSRNQFRHEVRTVSDEAFKRMAAAADTEPHQIPVVKRASICDQCITGCITPKYCPRASLNAASGNKQGAYPSPAWEKVLTMADSLADLAGTPRPER